MKYSPTIARAKTPDKLWQKHLDEIVGCERCPRLREHCIKIAKEKRKAFATETYWGKPVPTFGAPDAKLLIIGLAPAAHGANRTGRMFTGDRSGEWLYRAMHKAGFASQPTSLHASDGLVLQDAAITASARCAPPDNKPTPEELKNCFPYLLRELDLFADAKVYLALGKLAWDQAWTALEKWTGKKAKRPKFAHAATESLDTLGLEGRWLLGSYHPSQQNTFTARLTEPMIDAVFEKARKLSRAINR